MFLIALSFKIFLAIVGTWLAFSLAGVAIEWLKHVLDRLRP